MYCLEKFQRELAYFLDMDLRDLPKVQEILKAQGYTAVKKNDEIIELGSARQSFLEKIPADIAPSTFTKQEIEKLLTQFDNIENLTQHLNTRADSQARQELFHLLESTKNNPNIHYTKDSKDKYLKRFKDNDEHDPYFYLLITKDKDKTFITHLKTRDLNYLEKEILNAESIIKGADIIGDFRQQAGSAKHKSPTSTIDSTTNNLKWQQDGNVLRSVVELDNGEKLLLSKDRLENVYIQSNFKEQINSYDELILQESLEKFAKDELENKLARQIESKSGIAKLDSAQIQSQMQKEAQAQEAMAESMAQTQAKRDELIAQKEARLGKNADEVPLHKGQDIPYKPLRDTSIVLNDELLPFEAEFAVVRLSDIKPNFDNSNTQGRLIKQESVIANIVNDFKPELMFYQEGGVNGVPIITRDGKVVSGNHRSEALKEIFNAQTHNAETAREAYKKNAKDFLGVDLQDNEIIVRRLKENMSDKQILQLAFSSNIGRESTMGEKALSTLSLYRQNIATLPKLLQSENVNELKSLVAKHIDKQGNGLNTFDTNLALLTSLARNGKNSNILQSLDSIKGNSEYKNKIINMYVDNAGSFYNLAHNPSFKNLEFRDILSDSIYYTAKQNPTRQLDYEYLIQEIESFLNLAKDKQALQQALQLDSNKVQNLTAQAFGLALAKFSRQENPSSALYEALKQAPKALELATQPTFFTQGKALSEVDIYDFLEYLINQGQITQSQSVLSSLMPRLRELRESIANPQSSVSKVESSIEATSQISKEIKDIIDSSPQKGRDMQIIGEANFTPQVVEYAHKNNKKVAIDKLSQAEAEQLGYKYPNDVRVTIDYSAINHTLNRHGAESALVKNSGQKAVDYTDIAEYRNIVKGADESLFGKDDLGQDVILSFKQINGHAVVVESIRKKSNELAFKNMYFENGSYKNSNAYKNAVDSQKANHSPAPYGYEPHADDSTPPLKANDEIIPQNSTKAQSEYFNSLTNEYEKIKEIKKLHTQDDVLVRVMKINDRYIEPLSNMSVSKEYLQKQTAQSLKENITQAILGNQTQLKALQQGYNTYHLSPFQKEVLESALDIANNPAKLKEYKLQGLQKQLDNLNSNEAYHIEKGREYDKARYAKDRQELEKEISALKGTESSLESAPQKVDSSDIIFTDKKGKEHTLTKEVQEQWLNTFNLKSLDEAYTPKHSDEILQALGGKEIKLQLGSLKKLVAQGREQYIPQIKEVLDSPEAIMRDDMGEYLFIKHLKDDDYFVNVSFDNGEYLVSISNGIKETRNLNNKLEKGGSFIYQSPNFNSISQKLLQTSQYSANKIDSDIIPQSTAPLSKQAQKIQNKALEYNKLLKELFILFDKNPAAFNEKFEVFKQARNSLIDTLARDFKVAHFIKQLFDPLKMNNALHAAGFGYKTKKFRDGTLRVSGHMPTDSAIQKESRLSDMERERLQLAFAREYNIQDFLNDTHRQDFFTRLSDAVRNHFEFLHTYKTDVNKFLYTENRILPTDKITQAKQKLQKEREAFKEFLESNTAPKDAPTPPTLKRAFFDEVDFSDIIFTDTKGKEHTLTKEVQQQWLDTFNLKSLDDSYIPKHSDEILQALGGKEIKLQLGSLKKLVAQGREQYIPQIKEVLDSPEAILKDSDNAFLFAKHLKDDDYFVNVSVDKGEYLVSISNGIKETSNIKNKVENGAEVVYQSPNANSNLQTLLQASRYSANKIDNDIIPQMPKDNPQLVALQTKIQQSRQQIAESKNPDKEYLYQVFKPDEIIELEKQYFNQAMPQEYKELIQDFPRLYEQSLANELKTYAKDTDTIQEVTTQLLNDFKDKPFKNTAKHAELLLFNTLRDKAQELGFKELDINTPSFKVAFGKFQARLKKGDIQDLSEHIAIISLRKNRLRIEQSLNIKPLAEFGTNYAEHYHSGQSAIQKLLNEKQGQVSGAFYRKELGDIDLVWGDSSFGLKHILDKHGSEFENIAKELDEIIQNGEVVKRKGRDEAYNIEYKGFKVGINKGFNKQGENKWVVTAFDDNIEKTAKTAPANDSTKGASLPLNSSTIIPQKSTKLQSNAHLGSGLVGGSVSGIESDENGNLTFSPEKFALGFLGGVMSSKSIERLAKNPKARAVMERIYLKKDIMPKMQQGKKVDIETNLQNGLIYNTQETRHIGNLRADLKQALSPYLNKEIVNKATGITAQISTTGLNKIASKKAVDKSVANGFSRDEHFKVAGDLKNLFENATKKESYADKKQSKDVVSIHRFFTEITINDKQAQAKMTLKESIDYGNRIYSLELEELIPSP